SAQIEPLHVEARLAGVDTGDINCAPGWVGINGQLLLLGKIHRYNIRVFAIAVEIGLFQAIIADTAIRTRVFRRILQGRTAIPVRGFGPYPLNGIEAGAILAFLYRKITVLR